MRRQLILGIMAAWMLVTLIADPASAAKKPKKAPKPKAGPASLKGILGTRSLDQKGLMCVKLRRTPMSAAEILTLVKLEREDSIVALVVGMALEKGGLPVAHAVKLIRAMAGRTSQEGKAVVIAAWSPIAGEIMSELADSTPQDRVLAAKIAAVYTYAMAVAQDRDRLKSAAPGGGGGRNKKGGGKGGKAKGRGGKGGKQGGGGWFGRVDLEPILIKLLTNRSAEILELSILAAAYGRIEGLAEPIEGVKVSASTAGAGVEAARLFYLARIGRTLDSEKLGAMLKARVRPESRYLKLSPAMNSYQIRGNAIIYACQAVAAAGDATRLDDLHKLLAHRDLRIQIEAARALEAAGSHKSVDPLLAKLKDRKLTWPAKVAVLSALGAIPDVKSVEPLLAMLDAETGRFRQDAAYALASINCGKHGDNPSKWRPWWTENSGTFKPNDEATAKWRKANRVQDIKVKLVADFYGVSIISDRIVFVLDTSASMRGDKIASLKETMAQTLADTPDFVKFNIVDFGGIIRVMSKYGDMISGMIASAMASQIGQMDLSLGTRTFDAMEVAADLKDLDTIMYLSDGAPVAGQFQIWDSITRSFDLYIRYRPISIHCIYYSKDGGEATIKSSKTSANSYKGIPGGMKRLVDHHIGKLSLPGRNGDEPVEL